MHATTRSLALAATKASLGLVLAGCMTSNAAPPPREAPVSVRVSAATRREFAPTLSIVGTLEADHQAMVTSETMGKVTRVRAEIGALLEAGAPIAEVDAELKEAALAAASARFDKMQRDVERFTALRRESSITQVDLENAELALAAAKAEYRVAKRQLQDTIIRTPIRGFLTERPVDVGHLVQPGSPIGMVVDLTTLKLRLAINERDLARLRVGDKAEVVVATHPGEVFVGQVRSIGYAADSAGTFPVVVALANRKGAPLRAGQTATARLTLAPEAALVIPRLAVTGSGTDPAVLTVVGDVARRRPVRLGAEHDTFVEVASGLDEGERVITSGFHNVADGRPVSVAPN